MQTSSVELSLSDQHTIIFHYDESIPVNTVYWDTVSCFKNLQSSEDKIHFNAYYNISKDLKIKSVKSTVNTIFHGYIKSSENGNFFREYPTSEKKGFEWASYDPSRKSFTFSLDLLLQTEVDSTNFLQCAYRTSPGSNCQPSEHYQFANMSLNYTCSHPSMQTNGSSVSLCAYGYTHKFVRCVMYQPDEKVLSVINLTHKNSKNSFELTVSLKRTNENYFQVEILNSTNNLVISELNYNSLVFINNKSDLYTEILDHLNNILSSYKDDYEIIFVSNLLNNVDNNSSVNIKPKNSYISTLLAKDSYVSDSVNSLLQTV